MSRVGASVGSWRYSAPQNASRKKGRSSRLANPASWDELFSRTSRSRFIPAPLSAPKNSDAVFFVKPIV
jgi:hypothetical protein